MESPNPSPEIEALWRKVLTIGHSSRYAVLPSNPRCIGCRTPLGGLGGKVVSLLGIRPSRKNPSICNLCDDVLPPGGAEIDIAVVFADVRGSTGLGERLGPTKFAALLNRFYRVASDVIVSHTGLIDKLVGDEVMALFIPNVGPDYRQRAAETAVDLLRAVGYGGGGEPWLPVGAGVHAGLAYVGKVGSSGVGDFTALGDTVNTASRLQSAAAAGEVVMSEAAYHDVAHRYPDLQSQTITVRGREEALGIRVLRVGA